MVYRTASSERDQAEAARAAVARAVGSDVRCPDLLQRSYGALRLISP
jgi:hypothetical protein